ncbi:MAG TPA: heme peroxidase family protein [bacterium]
MNGHSCVISPQFKGALAHVSGGKYGRMFSNLPALEIDENIVRALGRSGSGMDLPAGAFEDPESDNPRIPAGFPFLGQFIAHDITRDPSLLHHHATLKQLRNFRTPRFDLEVVYGAGALAHPYFYDLHDPDMLLIGMNDAGPDDLPRNAQGQALIADSRNDSHMIISQLHLAFLKFHNRIVNLLHGKGLRGDAALEEARRLATWHYQWIVVHEFLPLSVGQEMVEHILRDGHLIYAFEGHPFIPVEFADAAYRFGHPQIRATYQLNDRAGRVAIFPDLAGMRPVPAAHVVDWARFFAIPGRRPPQASKRISARLVHALIDLPESIVGETERPEEHSLAYRDLERGVNCELPSGEAVARVIGLDPLPKHALGLQALGWDGETPLWYYVLKEAEIQGAGERLGEVGGRIVAEVLLGLLAGDPHSYGNTNPEWRPTLPGTRDGEFTMADLLVFAGVA